MVLCTLSKSDQCAPSDARKSLGHSLHSNNHTDWFCQYRSWLEKNHACLWVLGCVFLHFSPRTKCTHRTLSLPQCVTKMVCLPSFLSSTRNESCFKDGLDVERTTYVECKFFPFVSNLDTTHQIPVLSYSHQCVLELHESTSGNVWNFRYARALSCYFAIVLQSCSCSLAFMQMLSAILSAFCSNELLCQFLNHFDHCGEPIS